MVRSMKISSPENKTDVKGFRFRSISLHLAAVLLTKIEQSSFVGIDSDQTIDGCKKIFLIDIPMQSCKIAEKLVSDFNEKQLSINLYFYNRNLNFLRDKLFRNKKERC